MLFVVVVKTVVGIPAGVFHSMFAMVNMERFDLTPESNGRLLSYVGIITMVSQWSTVNDSALNSLSLSPSLLTADHARFWCWLLLKKIH